MAEAYDKKALRLLGQVRVPGETFMFGSNTTQRGEPFFYISRPGRGGFTVMGRDLTAFMDGLNEAVTEFKFQQGMK